MHGVALVPSDRLDMLWLDPNFAMNYHTWKDMDLIAGSPPTNLGGTFTSPPVAVALGQDRLDVLHLSGSSGLPIGRTWAAISPAHRWSYRPQTIASTSLASVPIRGCCTGRGTALL